MIESLIDLPMITDPDLCNPLPHGPRLGTPEKNKRGVPIWSRRIWYGLPRLSTISYQYNQARTEAI
jgi:hypothetical protein